MQYDIALPADYDMGIIRHRVAVGGPSFDAFPGLGLKCFLIGEKGRHGASANTYSPVYLWPRAEAMWGFLAGPAFAKIKADFGVPPVRVWPGFAWSRRSGLDPAQIARVTRTTARLPPETDLPALHDRERADAAATVGADDAPLARAVGLDPQTWHLVRFDFWASPTRPAPSGTGDYEVLHSSAPAWTELNP